MPTEISNLPELDEAPATDDVVAIVDISESTTKKITVDNIFGTVARTDVDNEFSVPQTIDTLITIKKTGGNNGLAVGRNTQSNTTGVNNTSLGTEALEDLTSGENNTAVGRGALRECDTGIGNTAVGRSALANTLGDENTAVGRTAGINYLGSRSTFLGEQSAVPNNSEDEMISIRAGQQKWICASGSPEGNFVANVGSLYTDKTGSSGAVLYVKESGTGNTGWVAK